MKLHDDFRALDENGHELATHIVLDECLRKRKLSHDPHEEIGREHAFPALTLHSAHKCTVRLSCDRSELDLHQDLNFRKLGR